LRQSLPIDNLVLKTNSVVSKEKRGKIATWILCGAVLSSLNVNVRPTNGDERKNQIALSQPLTVKWQYRSDHTTDLTPATDGSDVFLPLTNGILVALKALDGQLRWKADAGGQFSAAPTADERSVYLATQYEDVAGEQRHVHGTLRALSKETGVTLWMRTLPAPLSGLLVVGEQAIFAGSVDGRVYAFEKRTGLTLWINQYAESFSGSPALSGKMLYIGSNQGTLFALAQNDGKSAWHYRTHGAIQGPIAIANGAVFFGSGDSYVYAVTESHSRLLWRRRTGAAVQAVVALHDGLVVASLDNFAYLLSFNKGSLVWRRLLPGRISARPLAAADGALFTPLSTDSAIVLSPRDGKPVNTLPVGEENSSSAAAIVADDLVFVTTPHGLLAFAGSRKNQ
jgi:outer membrane protein assembly factor BamB